MFADDFVTIHHGDAWELAATLAPSSIHTIVTSPPYWGLRDYGDPNQFGLEATPDEYVAKLVDLFARLRPALRDDGTVWLNLGDCYCSIGHKKSSGGYGTSTLAGVKTQEQFPSGSDAGARRENDASSIGLKHKDLVGIPWRVAFALQADGWYLRSDIIWHKPNPMPESVTDRPTKAHEYVFLLSKSQRYYYDHEAVKDACSEGTHGGAWGHGGAKQAALGANQTGRLGNSPDDGKRNKRTVWTIPTKPFSAAHFAVFPPDLIKPCILAGCPERVCPECGAPWERVVERESMKVRKSERTQTKRGSGLHTSCGGFMEAAPSSRTTGFRPTCEHIPRNVYDLAVNYTGGTVLDPFMGSGTTAQVARSLGRKAIGFELNADYIEIAATKRLAQGQLL